MCNACAMDLGEYGVWTTFRAIGEDSGPAAASLAEELGFGTLWLGGSPRLPATRPLLAATDRLVIATGIVNVWQYEPAQLAAEFGELEAEFPGRLLVGIGIGHPEATDEYRAPLAKMTEFLDGLDAAAQPLPRDRRCLAALGPKMLDLSAARGLGTHPYFTPVAHTRFARERLGAGALIAPELACVLGDDPGRERARAYAVGYLRLRNYTRNLLRFGFTQPELDNGGSDRLIDELVPQGTAEQIAALARAHIGAGADHVCLQTVGISGLPAEQWRALIAALAPS